VSHLLYLHGFRSSAASFKALHLGRWLARRHPQVMWACPQLPPSPAAAMQSVHQVVHDWPSDTMAVVGSSLGGFYATCLAESKGCRAVVLNPAVHPARDLRPFVGELTAFHDPSQRFTFHAGYIDELQAMAPGALTDPGRYLAIIAKGDELLDWREMASRYQDAQLHVLEGSDHGLSDFEQHLPLIVQFLGLTP
jgi:predicted esterase YcpF (UPF0227 family)